MTHIASQFEDESRNAFSSNAVPTLAEIQHRVTADLRLESVERRDLLSANRRIASWTDGGLASIPATSAAIRVLFAGFSPARLGVSPKTLANIRSLVVRAVQRYAGGQQQLTKRIPPASEWAALLEMIPVKHRRHALFRLATFCSVMQVSPAAVCGQTLEGLYTALEAEEFVKKPRTILKHTISAWNSCRRSIASWPGVTLSSPFKMPPVTLALSALPPSFQSDVAHWKAAVTEIDELAEGAMGKPLRDETVALRLFQLRQLATALVDRGDLAISEITSLSVLFTPERFKSGMRWFLQRSNGLKTRRIYFLARALVRIARHYCRIEGEDLSRLQKVVTQLNPRQPRQMAPRNRERLRQFDDARNVKRLLRFPEDQFARAGREKNPLRAAKRAERGLAVALMIYGGLRQATLRKLHISGDFGWTRSGHQGVCHLHVPAEKIKNDCPAERVLPPKIGSLLTLYLAKYRPHLPGAQGLFLFPGTTGDMRSRSQFGAGLSQAFRKEAGLSLHPHLVRHAVAKIAVERDPGAYLSVSRVLGHASLDTTLAHYLGTEGSAATRHLDKLLDEALNDIPEQPLRRRKKGAG